MAGNAASFRPRTRTGKAPMGVGDLMLNPLDFNAVGDGSSNDSARVQAAIDEAAQIGGGCGVIIPRGRFYIPDGIDLTVPGVSLFSRGGVLGAGRVRVGSDVGQDFSETILDNIRYDGNAPYDSTKKAITLRNARGLTIKDPKIKRTGKAISVDAEDGASGFHTLGMVRINGFKSSEVDYSIYSNTATWDVCSDWHVTDSVSNFARICNFRFAGGIDGLIFDDITAFMLNYSSTSPIFADKTYNLWIDKAEQLHIDTANLFEAGLAGIRIDELGIFSMNGVNVIWPGQRVQSDAIEINGGNMRGAILGGSLSNWTKSAIGVHGGDASRLEIGTIGLRWLSTMESWKGTGVLSTSNCFRYTVDSAVTGLPAIRDYTNGMDLYDSIKGRTQSTSRDRKGTWSGLAAGTRRNISVVPQQDGQGNPVGTSIFLLSDMMEANVYGGTLTVFARSSAVSTAKVATYVLAISSSDPKCELIKAVGSVSGTAADDPSFTWSVVNNELRATPVGSTGGSGFWFDGTAVGALGLR